MAYSLLAHLYPRIKGSQEDVATYSLIYILEQSHVLRKEFTKLIGEKLEIPLEGELNYTCQDSDSEFGRPDIAGYQDGIVRVFCEAKFYAGLTDNQPVSYIKRLMKEYEKNGKQSGLVFICPANRKVSLWTEIRHRCEDSDLSGEDIEDKCVEYGFVRMSIITWSEIISALEENALAQDPERMADLKQLHGLCDRMDSDAFIPFKPEDFGAQVARDISRYSDVVDQVFQVLDAMSGHTVDTYRLRATPQRHGYTRYLNLDDVAVSIDYNRDLWKMPTSIESPFWMRVGDAWDFTEKQSRFMATIDARKTEHEFIALEPKPYLSIDELADCLAMQILYYVKAFKAFEQK